MAWIEERYRTITGSEQILNRGFIVHEALSEWDAVDTTRGVLAGRTPPETMWPPIDFSNPQSPINASKFLVDVAVDEIDLGNQDRDTADAKFFTVARYAYRAVCPIWDYNLALDNQQVTQSLSTRSFHRSGDANQVQDYAGAIEPRADGSGAKGTTKGFPQTRFAITWNPILTTAFSTGVLEYAKNIHRKVGTTNSAPFLVETGPPAFAGYEARSLRFDGWTGKLIDQKNDLYEYRYEFSYAEVTDGATIGGVTVPAGNETGGWDHLWITWDPVKKQTTSNLQFVSPEALQLNYDTILEESNFYDLFRDNGLDTGTPLVSSFCPGFSGFV